MSEKIYVRLKPHNPLEGHVSLMKSISGRKFYAGEWDPIDDTPNNRQLAIYLKTVKQEATGGPLAFNVCYSLDEVEAIRQAERMASLEKPRDFDSDRPVPPATVDGPKNRSALNDPAPTHVYDLPRQAHSPEPVEAPEPLPAPEPEENDERPKKKRVPKKRTAKKRTTKKSRSG